MNINIDIDVLKSQMNQLKDCQGWQSLVEAIQEDIKGCENELFNDEDTGNKVYTRKEITRQKRIMLLDLIKYPDFVIEQYYLQKKTQDTIESE